MNDPLETPDRRPLVYGGAALIILLVAAYLFWPRNADDLGDRDFIPDAVQSVASDESATHVASPDDAAVTTTDAEGAETVDLGDDQAPVQETRIVDAMPRATESSQTPPPPAKDAPKEIRRTDAGAGAQPSANGDWVLNVGSFSTRANANRRVEELARKGVTGHVQAASNAAGGSIYRVRVGYFGSSVEAKTYGQWLKRSQSLDSWAGRR